MSFSLENKIFTLYPDYDNVTDINKNAQGKGTLQRYNEALGADYDANLGPLLDDLLENTLLPLDLLVRFLPYAEAQLGINLSMGSPDEFRRMVVKYYLRWVQIKGTVKCITLLFSIYRVTCVLTEDFSTYGFDSDTETFDSPNRTFDSGCDTCGTVSIALTGSGGVPSGERQKIYKSIIDWNLPIHAILTEVTYNGTPILL